MILNALWYEYDTKTLEQKVWAYKCNASVQDKIPMETQS